MLEKLRNLNQKILSLIKELGKRGHFSLPPFCVGEDIFIWLEYLRTQAEFALTICEMVKGIVKGLTFCLCEDGAIHFLYGRDDRKWTATRTFEELLVPFLEKIGVNNRPVSRFSKTRITIYKWRKLKKFLEKLLEEEA